MRAVRVFLGLLFVLITVSAAVDARAVNEGRIVEFGGGESLTWSLGSGDYWLVVSSGGGNVTLDAPRLQDKTFGHAIGHRVQFGEPATYTVHVREGSGRAMLARADLLNVSDLGPAGDAYAVGVVEVPGGACRAFSAYPSSVFATKFAVEGSSLVTATAPDATLRVFDGRLDLWLEQPDVVAFQTPDEGDDQVIVQACRGAGNATTFRVESFYPVHPFGDEPRDVPLPPMVAGLGVVVAGLTSRLRAA